MALGVISRRYLRGGTRQDAQRLCVLEDSRPISAAKQDNHILYSSQEPAIFQTEDLGTPKALCLFEGSGHIFRRVPYVFLTDQGIYR